MAVARDISEEEPVVLVVQEEAAVPASKASAGQGHPAAADLEGA